MLLSYLSTQSKMLLLVLPLIIKNTISNLSRKKKKNQCIRLSGCFYVGKSTHYIIMKCSWMHQKKDDKWRSYCWIVDGNRTEAFLVGRKLVYARQPVQVPDDARSVIRPTHKDAVAYRCSKAGHCLSVSIQSLVGKNQPINHSRRGLIY